MKRFLMSLVLVLVLVVVVGTVPANALLISGPDIIAAPASVIDDNPGAENEAQQAFNEAQNVLLTRDIQVDGGWITAGTTVSSHMIFLNTPGNSFTEDLATWVFDGDIIGVMSDYSGNFEYDSNDLLAASGTVYPSPFRARGLEDNDWYEVDGNSIQVYMAVTEPGDWIRVVTEATEPVPEPGTLVLLGFGLAGLVGIRRKMKKN